MPARPSARALRTSCLLAATACAAPALAGIQDDISVGIGLAADELCTRMLVSGDSRARVEWRYVAPQVGTLPLIWRITTDDSGASVGTSLDALLGTGPRQALHRPGLGCTVVPPGTAAADVLAQPFTPRATRPASTAPWPLGEGAAETTRLDAARLAIVQQQGDKLFADGLLTAWTKRQNTYAYLVVQDGRLVYERYADGYTADQPQHAWSMTKTLTTLVAGLLARDGRLQPDATPPVPQLATGVKAGISWRHLLQMRSGLEWTENFGGYGPNSIMLWLQPDHGAYAASQPLACRDGNTGAACADADRFQPGERFLYSSGSTNVAALGIKRLLGSHQAFYDYYQGRLFEPLGVRGGIVMPDASGTPSGGTRGVLRPRDWLKLGQLILDKGRWQGRALLDPAWIDFMTAPSPAYAGYGAGVWLYGSLEMPTDMPRDIVVLWGVKGNYVMLVPSKRLAVMRMGYSQDEAGTAQRMFEAVRALNAAF